jgi:hypothetical protein
MAPRATTSTAFRAAAAMATVTTVDGIPLARADGRRGRRPERGRLVRSTAVIEGAAGTETEGPAGPVPRGPRVAVPARAGTIGEAVVLVGPEGALVLAATEALLRPSVSRNPAAAPEARTSSSTGAVTVTTGPRRST